MQTIWLSPTDIVTGDPNLKLTYPIVSIPKVTITCPNGPMPSGFKWIFLGLRLPEKIEIEEIIVCYQISNSHSFISQATVTEMGEPDQAIVIHDVGTTMQSTTPVCQSI